MSNQNHLEKLFTKQELQELDELVRPVTWQELDDAKSIELPPLLRDPANILCRCDNRGSDDGI